MCWRQPKWQILLSAFLSSLLLYRNVFWGTKTNSLIQTWISLCSCNAIIFHSPTPKWNCRQFARQLLWNQKQSFTFILQPADLQVSTADVWARFSHGSCLAYPAYASPELKWIRVEIASLISHCFFQGSNGIYTSEGQPATGKELQSKAH